VGVYGRAVFQIPSFFLVPALEGGRPVRRLFAVSALMVAALLAIGPAAAVAAPQHGPAVTFSCGTALHPPGIFHTLGAPGSVWIDGRHYAMVALDAPWTEQTYGAKTGLLDDAITCTSPSGTVTAVVAPTP